MKTSLEPSRIANTVKGAIAEACQYRDIIDPVFILDYVISDDALKLLQDAFYHFCSANLPAINDYFAHTGDASEHQFGSLAFKYVNARIDGPDSWETPCYAGPGSAWLPRNYIELNYAVAELVGTTLAQAAAAEGPLHIIPGPDGHPAFAQPPTLDPDAAMIASLIAAAQNNLGAGQATTPDMTASMIAEMQKGLATNADMAAPGHPSQPAPTPPAPPVTPANTPTL